MKIFKKKKKCDLLKLCDLKCRGSRRKTKNCKYYYHLYQKYYLLDRDEK